MGLLYSILPRFSFVINNIVSTSLLIFCVADRWSVENTEVACVKLPVINGRLLPIICM